jgi:hypothetical protein
MTLGTVMPGPVDGGLKLNEKVNLNFCNPEFCNNEINFCVFM